MMEMSKKIKENKFSMWYVVKLLGKYTNMNFDFICKISLEFSKTGITFAYELGLKSFLYEKSSTLKVDTAPW